MPYVTRRWIRLSVTVREAIQEWEMSCVRKPAIIAVNHTEYVRSSAVLTLTPPVSTSNIAIVLISNLRLITPSLLSDTTHLMLYVI